MNFPANWFIGTEEKKFYVWLNPEEHNFKIVGSFCAMPNYSKESLMFLPNPNFQGFISPFQNNLMRNYIAEYNLELARQHHSPNYPCRLESIFLFDSEQEAIKYQERHFDHVGNRSLESGFTVGPYTYSQHDSSWVNFLRLGHMMDPQDIHNVTSAYWRGESVENCTLSSCGKPWTQTRITETLFVGRIDFRRSKTEQDAAANP
jgi:hypothetical protein